MKNIALKTVICFLLLWIIWNIAYIVSVFYLMNCRPEQYHEVIVPGVIIWFILAFVGVLIFASIAGSVQKGLKHLKNLPDEKLVKTAKKALNMNLTTTAIFFAMLLLASLAMYMVLIRNFGPLASKSIWVGGTAGSISVPFMVFTIISFLYSKPNRAIYAELNARELTASGISMSIRNKMLMVFGASIIAVILWIGLFGYYSSVNQTIEEIKRSRYDKLQLIVQNLNSQPDTLRSNIKQLSTTINQLYIPKNEILLLTDNKGNIINQKNIPEQFEAKISNIDSLIQSNCKTIYLVGRNKQSAIDTLIKTGMQQAYFYDNINQNVMVFESLNSGHGLVLINHLHLSGLNAFWLWFGIFIIIGLVVVGVNTVMLSGWITRSTHNLNNLFNKLAQGNFDGNATKDSEDELGELSNNYNKFIVSVRKLIDAIQNTAYAVADAGTQLTTTSQELAQNSNEQASSVEEISSSMEEMAATINSNTDIAENTGKVSKNSAKTITQSNEIINQMINHVSEISEKVSIIIEIADKTDMLSINAAIEAARAGEAGKGFAVVANEIRNLADHTIKASDEITDLSKKGQDISDAARKSLSKTVNEIEKNVEQVTEIVAASHEQKGNVDAVNQSMQQLTNITQQYSASAEELSTSAEELSAQAQHLKELVAEFRIENQSDTKTTRQVSIIDKKTAIKQEKDNNGVDIKLDNDETDTNYEKF